MSTNERNTHFQGSAQQVAYKILDLAPGALSAYSRDDQKLIAELIAQYAYDLMAHAIRHINKNAIYTEHPHFDAFMLAIVPDMTEWPPS